MPAATACARGTVTAARPVDPELLLAMRQIVAGHHDGREAARQRAEEAARRLTTALTALAAAVLALDVALFVA